MQKPPMASAPPAEFNVQSPAPTAGYQTPGHPAPNPGAGGFTPRMGEGQTAARGRVIDPEWPIPL